MEEKRGSLAERREKTSRASAARKKNIDPDQVYGMAKLGLSIDLISELIGVSRATLNRHLKKNAELAKAIEDGQFAVRSRLRAELLKQAFKGNARILLRMAESEGLLKPQGLALQGKDGAAIEHQHSGIGGSEFFAEAGELMRQIQDAARNRDSASHEDAVAGEGPTEATSTD
jgi:AcrR family transcriptional regulator